MIELKPRFILPFVGAAMLSLGLVACRTPSVSGISESSGNTASDTIQDHVPYDVASILRNPYVEALRVSVASMGPDWVFVIARWGNATATVTNLSRPSLARRISPYLFDAESEGSTASGGKFPGEEFEFSHTAEVYWDMMRRDRWAIHPRERSPENPPSDGIFLAIKFKGDDYAKIPDGVIPIEYWRVDGPNQATKVAIFDIMNSEV